MTQIKTQKARTARRYTDASIIASLQRVAAGETLLSRPAYARRRGPGDPSTGLIEFRFGTWNSALVAAGIAVTDQDPQLQGSAPSWTEEELTAALQRCHDAMGKVNVIVYSRWRLALDDLHSVPSPALINIRIGWANVPALITS